MPVIVLDTNVISELMRPQPDQGVLAWANSLDPESAAITAMNEAEILHGLARLPDGRRKQALCESWDALANAWPGRLSQSQCSRMRGLWPAPPAAGAARCSAAAVAVKAKASTER